MCPAVWHQVPRSALVTLHNYLKSLSWEGIRHLSNDVTASGHTQLSQDLNLGLFDFKLLSFHITRSVSLVTPNKLPCPRPTGTRKTKHLRVLFQPKDTTWWIPLWDLVEEKLDLGDIWELLPERFLRTAVGCSGKDTCTDSVDAARLMDFRESEEALLPRLRDSSSSDSSLPVPLSVMSSSSHKPWH